MATTKVQPNQIGRLLAQKGRRLLFVSILVEPSDFADSGVERFADQSLLDLPWWLETLQLPRNSFSFVNATRERLSQQLAKNASAILLGGSRYFITEKRDWQLRLCDWLRSLADSEVPIFGSCGGHEAVAHAFGGVVGSCVDNVGDKHVGYRLVHTIPREPSEPLFQGLPATFPAFYSHRHGVLRLPPRARSLASSSHTPNAVVAHSPYIWTVQFHPEMNYARASTSARTDGCDLLADPTSEQAESCGRRLILNFLSSFVVSTLR